MTERTYPDWTHYLLLFFLCAFVLLLPFTKIADFDLFFHLRLGQSLIEEGSLYRVDTYSYTSYGSPQYLLEWLSNGILYAVYKHFGFFGLGVLKSVLFGLMVFVVVKTLQLTAASRRFWHIALAIIVMAYAMRFRLDLRPYYFTYLFVALYMYVFYRYMQEEKVRYLYLLCFVQIFWSNTHGGMIMGPPLASVFFLTEALRKKAFPSKMLLPLVLLWLVSGLNPEGLRPYIKLFSFVPGSASGLTELGEWMGLDRHLLWGYGLRYTWGFQLLVAGASVYLVIQILRKRVDLLGLLLFSFALFYSVKHVRLIAVSSIIIVPLFFHALEELAVRFKRHTSVLNLCVVLLLSYLFVFSVLKSDIYSFGSGKKEGVFPDGAINFLEEHNIQGNGFNTITVGSYMLWRCPERKVFIDGRLVASREFQEDYAKAIKTSEGFAAVDRVYDFNYALIDYNLKYKWRFPLHLNWNPRWVPVYWDNTAVVYLKNKADNRSIIRKFGYRVVRPNFDDFSYLDHYLKVSDRDLIMKAIDADIKRNPLLQDAHLAKAYLAYYSGQKDIAFEELKKSLELRPDIPFEHTAIAYLYMERGDRDAALRHLKKALKLNPEDRTAKELLKRLKK
jgi:tetratricopeptide (TPR) repeat protein